MSKWTEFRDRIETTVADFFSHAEAEVTTYLQPAIAYITSNGGQAALQLAETVLAGFVAGSPWADILAAFIEQAEAQGIKLAEGAAQATLALAQSNMIAKQAA